LTKIPARWYGHNRASRVRVIVIHTTESPERDNAARAVANFFKHNPNKTSAHIVVDNKEAIRCVEDNKAAWAAPGCNFDGLHLELIGTARQTRTNWNDKFSQDMLDIAAEVSADWCMLYGIPVTKLLVAQLIGGKRGFVGHIDVSKAYKLSNHFDPGPNFPWKSFLKKVENELKSRQPQT
jgi:N-acetyl-anhydromuramyl-L-alanine amidase AmpD